MTKTISEGELLVKFARELKEIVESFEEEAEILANRQLMEEIERNEEAYESGDYAEFRDVKTLRETLDL